MKGSAELTRSTRVLLKSETKGLFKLKGSFLCRTTSFYHTLIPITYKSLFLKCPIDRANSHTACVWHLSFVESLNKQELEWGDDVRETVGEMSRTLETVRPCNVSVSWRNICGAKEERSTAERWRTMQQNSWFDLAKLTGFLSKRKSHIGFICSWLFNKYFGGRGPERRRILLALLLSGGNPASTPTLRTSLCLFRFLKEEILKEKCLSLRCLWAEL